MQNNVYICFRINKLNMITTKQRLVFNLNDFIGKLEVALISQEIEKEEGSAPYVQDVVNELESFIQHSSSNIANASKKYLYNHPTVCTNEKLKSFIKPCFDSGL